MIYLVVTVHVVISIFLVLVVLLQQGKGADLSVFGGGGSQAAFGARGAATVLHKLTVICFVLFIVTTLSIGILESRSAPSVMGGVETDASAAPDVPAPTGPAGGQLPVTEPASEPEPTDASTQPDGSTPAASPDSPTQSPNPEGASPEAESPQGSPQ